jgi:hypothetical protein
MLVLEPVSKFIGQNIPSCVISPKYDTATRTGNRMKRSTPFNISDKLLSILHEHR